MNKKIGLLNFHYSDHNYGAVLQAAALADVINRLDYSVEHIDFIPNKMARKKTLRQLLITVLAALGVKSLIIRMLGKKEYIKPTVTGGEVFEQFRDVWVTRSQQTYTASQQLNTVGTTYRAVVVGSDQVWRPNMFVNKHQDVDAYFLSFLPDSVSRVSYAASFGVDKWEGTSDAILSDRVRKAMTKFNAVSVREQTGVAICRDHFGVTAQHVLDPTLLNGVDFFERVIAKAGVSKQNENVVYYKLDVDTTFISAIKLIGDILQVPTEDIYYQMSEAGYRYIPVADWLAKIRDSKFVVTDSFHCVCLAILFNKEFICFANKDRGLARLQSLLASLGIDGRLCDEQQSLSSFFAECKPIEYHYVNTKLAELRIGSLEFLKDALE
ncbi:polysaccharide pyruvyl transferase family protein [Vibrio cholerae]|uniref:polysaccharide pyruvyl transferase family protein n=1 Tax=Vibrio cholerae TaxID=666 RepID=UPI0011D85A47|nr:polysaccharide pyruvyl transferase family protein [Vibrio cholerae]TXX95373.1 polysaccharide pyruvyl transferase family protein [Vibrio cholerae]BCN17976.1 putative monosaccharide biosynthesis protein [Vibrio cholerae]GIC28074.1 MurB family protein [Vibrio cholerae]